MRRFLLGLSFSVVFMVGCAVGTMQGSRTARAGVSDGAQRWEVQCESFVGLRDVNRVSKRMGLEWWEPFAVGGARKRAWGARSASSARCPDHSAAPGVCLCGAKVERGLAWESRRIGRVGGAPTHHFRAHFSLRRIPNKLSKCSFQPQTNTEKLRPGAFQHSMKQTKPGPGSFQPLDRYRPTPFGLISAHGQRQPTIFELSSARR